ncbi:MAG: RIO1 family regulatory kinase/ATPase [Phycisphaeraceae bacterium]|nr:RIO1 family regulatory kinase/ATPase [Phycisphaeraceae bacterium]
MVTQRREDQRIDAVIDEVFADDAVFRQRGWSRTFESLDEPADYLFALPDDEPDPEEVFRQLRFGGQFVLVADRRSPIRRMAKRIGDDHGFVVEHEDAVEVGKTLGVLPKKVHYLVARRTELILPGEISHHFTFDVRLTRNDQSPTGWAVLKQLPSPSRVFKHLKDKYPNVDDEKLGKSTRQLVDKVFPVLLTREVAFLKLLQRDLPRNWRSRVPNIYEYEQGPDNYVDSMQMNWLRQGGRKMTQIEFARDAAQLMHLVHERAKIIHLDMRLDNILITDEGVCLIDFGSAVRRGEAFRDTSLLKTIFNELMSTSGVQKVMGRLIDAGQITSTELIRNHRKMNPAADLFYLTLQLKHLHKHPDYRGLIEYDPESEEAARVEKLAQEVLRPKNPKQPTITAARDLLERVEKIEMEISEELITLDD